MQLHILIMVLPVNNENLTVSCFWKYLTTHDFVLCIHTTPTFYSYTYTLRLHAGRPPKQNDMLFLEYINH